MLSGVITSELVSGVLSEVIAVIPVVIPAAISFIAVRKGINFVIGMLRAA